MALPGTPTPFIPRGLYDTLDSTTAPAGACASLQNLIHDITTRGVWVPRPGAVEETEFSGFIAPSFVSAALNIGPLIYGMVATARNPGHDEPFVYDTEVGTFIPVGNVTAANTPLTQPSTGGWTPPDMDTVGTRVLVTHPGFSTDPAFGWFDIGSFSLSFTGDFHANATIDGLSINPVNVGIAIGQLLSSPGNLAIGTYVVGYSATTITVSQNAISSAGAQTISAGGGSLASPLWGAGNTAINPLPGRPNAVQQFQNRAWFAVGNQAWFTDALQSDRISNATNFLTLGSTVPINAFGTIPIEQTTGGTLAALIAFKVSGGYFQITGDIATTNLALNGPVGNVGCAGPRTVVQTPAGLWFMAADGVRQIGFSGLISPAPVPDVIYPFTAAFNPSRAAAAYNSTVYRISLETLVSPLDTDSGFVEYWYDFEIGQWSGPHTCSYDVIVPVGDGFVFGATRKTPPFWGVAIWGAFDWAFAGTALFRSDIDVMASSVYTEFGDDLIVLLRSAFLPDTSPMAASAIIEATIELGLASGGDRPTVTFYDQRGNVLATAPTPGVTQSPVWGRAIWGSFNWAFTVLGLAAYNCDWPIPLVYKNGSFSVSSRAFGGLRIGAFWRRVEALGYMNTQEPA